MNPSFVLVLKSERCIDKQNRQLSFLVKRDTKIANLKVKAHEKRNSCHNLKITNNTDEKGLNVEHFSYHITINYDKSSPACTD